MVFFCISAFGRGLTYSNHLLILSQCHHNLYGMELPSKVSFSLFLVICKESFPSNNSECWYGVFQPTAARFITDMDPHTPIWDKCYNPFFIDGESEQ